MDFNKVQTHVCFCFSLDILLLLLLPFFFPFYRLSAQSISCSSLM